MKSFLHRLLPAILLALATTNIAYATTYTAVASGNYTSAATWQGGVVPPSVFSGGDVVTIPGGITVTATSDIIFTGTSIADLLTVNGSLSMANNTLRIEQARLAGIGAITADSFGGNFIHGFNFNGNINAKSMDGSTISANTNVVFSVDDLLYVADSMQMDHGTLNIFANTLIMLNGSMSRSLPTLKIQGSANMSFNGSYNVHYIGDRIHTGIELKSLFLNNITVAMSGNLQQVILEQDLIMSNKLNIQSGMLVLNGNDLEFDATSDLEMGATGTIKSDLPSDLTINATNAFTSPIKFHSTGYTVDELYMNTNSTVKLGSDLYIDGYLDIIKGKIDVMTNTLKMPAAFNFTNGYDKNRYIITGGGGFVSADITGSSSQPGLNYYPIGTATEYLPCIVTTPRTYFNVLAQVTAGVKEQGATGTDWGLAKPLVNATWQISNTDNNVNVELEATWFPSAEVNGFDKTNGVYMSHYTPANVWDTRPRQQPTSYTDGSFSIARTPINRWGYYAVFDKNTVGISDLTMQQDIKVHPNPAQNILNISIKQSATAYILNTTGVRVQINELVKGNNTIDINTLPSGVYFLKLTGTDINTTLNFVKQ